MGIRRKLGENVVLGLMECLTLAFSFDVFMNNYFTYFRLLTLGVKRIRATGVVNKNRWRKCPIYHCEQTAAKKKKKTTNVATLNSANQAKKQFNFGTGWLEP